MREARKLRVAPIVLANDTKNRAYQNPNKAPPANVMTAAPGSDSAVTATYPAKKGEPREQVIIVPLHHARKRARMFLQRFELQ